MATVKLILVRHGQTSSNVGGLLDTELPGAPLTELGHRQARALVDLLGSDTIASVSASQARRAQQTAAPLAAARGLAVQVREGLKEIAAGDWEMSGEPDDVRGWLTVIGAWMDGDLDAATPGPRGENGHQCLDRFDRAVAEVWEERPAGSDDSGEAQVVVAHGAVIRTWASLRSANLDADYGAAHPLTNTAVVRLEGDPAAGWICTAWGETELAVATAADPTTQVMPTS